MNLKSGIRSLVFLTFVSGAFVIVPPRHAHAQGAPANASKTQAEALVQQGIQLRKQGADEQALGLFQRALAIDPAPKTRAQVGLAQLALGRWADAEQNLTQALASAKDPWIAKNAQPLREALTEAQGHLGTLEVAVNISDPEVLIDGASKGTPSGPLRLPAGTYSVEVRRQGFHPVVRRVEVSPGQITRESIELSRVPTESQAAGAAPPAATAPVSDAAPPPAASASPTPEAPPPTPASPPEKPRESKPKPVRFEFGPRLGFGVPLGTVSEGSNKLSDVIGGQVPFALDLGVRIINRFFVGAYLGFGVGVGGEFSNTCSKIEAAGGTCDYTSFNLRLGLQALYHFRPPGTIDPWVGLGFGFELTSGITNHDHDGEDYDDAVVLTGFEFPNLQAGLDFPLGKKVGFGPFVTWTAARYSDLNYTCTGDCALDDTSTGIENTSYHYWLLFGARMTFVL